MDRVTIGFGLVSIPARIYSTGAPGSDVSFHWIHETCGSRVKMQWYCPTDDEVVERSDLIKGYEVSKGRIVTFEPDELKALDAVASNAIALQEFVPASAVDPIYFDRHYYLGPDKGGEHAYGLLRAAMEKAELVGIATYAARGNQYVVVVRPDGPGLAMHQLRYPDEVRGWDDVELPHATKPREGEMKLAEQVIAQITTDELDLSKYKDEVKERVLEAIAEKAKTGTIEVEPAEAPAPTKTTDLMEVLRQSLAGAGAHRDKGSRAPHARVRAKRASHARASAASAGTRHRRRKSRA
ncbi:MAG TPA: Ku protein [Kofleriaceae bacterium]|nr:Ku protein [Kofleriaceae bacterium]